MGKAAFLSRVESQWDGVDSQRREEVAHSVLYHLWRRLPFHERERVLKVLSPDVIELLREPQNPHEPQMTAEQREQQGSIEYDTYDSFCEEVRRETELKGDGEDERAIQAVFDALKAELPEEEVMHIHTMLPVGLKQMWTVA